MHFLDCALRLEWIVELIASEKFCTIEPHDNFWHPRMSKAIFLRHDTLVTPYCPEVQAPTVMRTITLSMEVFTFQGNCLTLSWKEWPRNNPHLEKLSPTPCISSGSGAVVVMLAGRTDTQQFRCLFSGSSSLRALLDILTVAEGC